VPLWELRSAPGSRHRALSGGAHLKKAPSPNRLSPFVKTAPRARHEREVGRSAVRARPCASPAFAFRFVRASLAPRARTMDAMDALVDPDEAMKRPGPGGGVLNEMLDEAGAAPAAPAVPRALSAKDEAAVRRAAGQKNMDRCVHRPRRARCLRTAQRKRRGAAQRVAALSCTPAPVASPRGFARRCRD